MLKECHNVLRSMLKECHHVYFNPQNTDWYIEYSPPEYSRPVVKMLGETYKNEAQYMQMHDWDQLSLFFHSEEVEVFALKMIQQDR